MLPSTSSLTQVVFSPNFYWSICDASVFFLERSFLPKMQNRIKFFPVTNSWTEKRNKHPFPIAQTQFLLDRHRKIFQIVGWTKDDWKRNYLLLYPPFSERSDSLCSNEDSLHFFWPTCQKFSSLAVRTESRNNHQYVSIQIPWDGNPFDTKFLLTRDV